MGIFDNGHFAPRLKDMQEADRRDLKRLGHANCKTTIAELITERDGAKADARQGLVDLANVKRDRDRLDALTTEMRANITRMETERSAADFNVKQAQTKEGRSTKRAESAETEIERLRDVIWHANAASTGPDRKAIIEREVKSWTEPKAEEAT